MLPVKYVKCQNRLFIIIMLVHAKAILGQLVWQYSSMTKKCSSFVRNVVTAIDYLVCHYVMPADSLEAFHS